MKKVIKKYPISFVLGSYFILFILSAFLTNGLSDFFAFDDIIPEPYDLIFCVVLPVLCLIFSIITAFSAKRYNYSDLYYTTLFCFSVPCLALAFTTTFFSLADLAYMISFNNLGYIIECLSYIIGFFTSILSIPAAAIASSIGDFLWSFYFSYETEAFFTVIIFLLFGLACPIAYKLTKPRETK